MDITINVIYLILFFILALIVFKYLETFWSYKVYKPYMWEEAVKQNTISKKLKSLEHTYYDKIRFYSMWFQIERIKKENIEGNFAELGVYKGETAKLIVEMSSTQKLHLFDTFEGFSEKDLQHEMKKGGKYTTNEFAGTNLETVKRYIDGDEHVIFHPGYFPETTKGLENERFSFVHIDADLYLPTLEALKFFYPRLSPGGIIMVHDYNHTWDGIKRAFDEFMPTIPENLIELPDWKGSAIIVKNSRHF